ARARGRGRRGRPRRGWSRTSGGRSRRRRAGSSSAAPALAGRVVLGGVGAAAHAGARGGERADVHARAGAGTHARARAETPPAGGLVGLEVATEAREQGGRAVDVDERERATA